MGNPISKLQNLPFPAILGICGGLFLVIYAITNNNEKDDKNLFMEEHTPDLDKEEEMTKSKAYSLISEGGEWNVETAPNGLFEDEEEEVISDIKFAEADFNFEEEEKEEKKVISTPVVKTFAKKRTMALKKKTPPQADAPVVKRRSGFNDIKAAKSFTSTDNTLPEHQAIQNADVDKVINLKVFNPQTIRDGSRVTFRTTEQFTYNQKAVRKNSLLYGTASFKDNRALITIHRIQVGSNSVVANMLIYDTDGMLGIYSPELSNEAKQSANAVSSAAGRATDKALAAMTSGYLTGASSVLNSSRPDQKISLSDGYQVTAKFVPHEVK